MVAARKKIQGLCLAAAGWIVLCASIASGESIPYRFSTRERGEESVQQGRFDPRVPGPRRGPGCPPVQAGIGIDARFWGWGASLARGAVYTRNGHHVNLRRDLEAGTDGPTFGGECSLNLYVRSIRLHARVDGWRIGGKGETVAARDLPVVPVTERDSLSIPAGDPVSTRWGFSYLWAEAGAAWEYGRREGTMLRVGGFLGYGAMGMETELRGSSLGTVRIGARVPKVSVGFQGAFEKHWAPQGKRPLPVTQPDQYLLLRYRLFFAPYFVGVRLEGEGGLSCFGAGFRVELAGPFLARGELRVFAGLHHTVRVELFYRAVYARALEHFEARTGDYYDEDSGYRGPGIHKFQLRGLGLALAVRW